MIDLAFNDSFVSTLKKYVSKEKNKKDLVYLLNQIDHLKSSYQYIYNYIKSTIYVDYLFEIHKEGGFPLKESVYKQQLNKLLNFYNKIQKLLKYVTKLSGAASYMDTENKKYWSYYNMGEIRYKDNMNLQLCKELIINFFYQCLKYQENIKYISSKLLKIYKTCLKSKAYSTIFYDMVGDQFLKHFDEFERIL